MSKVSWKDIFAKFQYAVSKITLLLQKEVVLHTITLMHYKAF